MANGQCLRWLWFSVAVFMIIQVEYAYFILAHGTEEAPACGLSTTHRWSKGRNRPRCSSLLGKAIVPLVCIAHPLDKGPCEDYLPQRETVGAIEVTPNAKLFFARSLGARFHETHHPGNVGLRVIRNRGRGRGRFCPRTVRRGRFIRGFRPAAEIGPACGSTGSRSAAIFPRKASPPIFEALKRVGIGGVLYRKLYEGALDGAGRFCRPVVAGTLPARLQGGVTAWAWKST